MRTVLIDNYDSYTFNVFHLIGEVNDEEPIVVRNDEVARDDLAGLQPDNIVISPWRGRPEHPRDVAVSLDMLLEGVVFDAGRRAPLDDLDDGVLPGSAMGSSASSATSAGTSGSASAA